MGPFFNGRAYLFEELLLKSANFDIYRFLLLDNIYDFEISK